MSSAGSVATRPDTGEMVMVHNTFRRCFTDLPKLVREVEAGDVERAGIVSAFYGEVATGLHHHHTGEDELLWPLLHERVVADADYIVRMEGQHQRVAELLERADDQVVAFRAHATAQARDEFATTLTELGGALAEHMADEEDYILPLVEEHLTVAEWEALGERGRAGIPKDRLLIQVGYLLDGIPVEHQKAFLAKLPLPARIAWALIGRRKYRQEMKLIYGS